MDTSKGCLKIGGPKGCWTGCQTGEGKGEGPEEPGERTFMQKWNGDTYGTETGKTGKHGGRDGMETPAARRLERQESMAGGMEWRHLRHGDWADRKAWQA